MDELPERCRIAIVGGGVGGLAAAWALAEAGVDGVVVIERSPELASHASGRNAAMCRALAEDDAWTELTARGAAWLAAPPPDFADRPLLDGRGAILLTRDPAPLAARAARHGVRCSPMDAAGLGARWPGLAIDRGGLWFPDDGVIDLAALIGGFAARARRGGARVVTGCEVVAIAARGDGAQLQTSRGALAAEVVVAAAGPWIGELAARAGIAAGFVARKRHIYALAADGGAAPILWNVDEDEWYARPGAGGLWVCACDHAPSAPGDVAVDPAVEALVRARIPAALAGAPIERAWACQRTFAEGGPPRLGFDERVPWWCWAAGLGGHGITASAELGRRVAAAITSRT